MLFVRWKPYGFTHIVKGETEKIDMPRYGTHVRGRTMCGSTFSVVETWDRRFAGRMDSYRDKCLVPGPDDGKRPVCGNCQKVAK